MNKYELTKESIQHAGRTLYRIKRLSDGLFGGYIESESNLSQIGSCFVYEDAKVYGKARVYGEAVVYGKARVYGEAVVYGKARVYGEAEVCGEARVYGEAEVCGEAVATKLVQNIITPRHNITMTDTHIAIGCENHTIEHWRKHLKDIGLRHRYTTKERNAVRHLIKGMLLLREGK